MFKSKSISFNTACVFMVQALNHGFEHSTAMEYLQKMNVRKPRSKHRTSKMIKTNFNHKGTRHVYPNGFNKSQENLRRQRQIQYGTSPYDLPYD